MNQWDDWSRLMALAQAGDGAAYAKLLKAIVPYLRSIARRRLEREEDVEDAVQDTLLAIHAVRHTYDPRRPVGPWLATIAQARTIDRTRRIRRTLGRESEIDAESETFLAPATNQYEERDRARLVRGAVGRLPERQREAVELLKLRELSLKEASLESGMSIPALKVAVHRAMKTLRVILGSERSR